MRLTVEPLEYDPPLSVDADGMEAAEVGFNFSNRFDGGTRKSSKRLAALAASSLRFARGAMLRNSRTTPSQNSVSLRLSPKDRII